MEQTTDKLTAIRSCARRLRLSSLTMNAAEELVRAQTSSPSYDDFLLNILRTEVEGREARQKALRYKAARLPMDHDLDRYDFSNYNGLNLTQLNQLRELHWVEAGYNIMLAGPSGVGKTYLASGLCADAIERGYKGHRQQGGRQHALRMDQLGVRVDILCHNHQPFARRMGQDAQ